MPYFRKRPVTIEARRVDFSNGVDLADLAAWCGATAFGAFGIRIATLEGEMTALDGDWIIKGVQGEFYPCKPEIFSATYEPADTSPADDHDFRCENCGAGIYADDGAARTSEDGCWFCSACVATWDAPAASHRSC